MVRRMIAICLAVAVAVNTAASVDGAGDDCKARLAAVGLNEHFFETVAHALHWMTIEDLQMFKANVSENNGVPVTNPDLTSKNYVLRNAPHAQVSDGGQFKSYVMRVMDRVLSNMDRKDYDMILYNPLEKLAHAMHMVETWEVAAAEYRKLVASSASKDACPCALDVENNGILEVLSYRIKPDNHVCCVEPACGANGVLNCPCCQPDDIFLPTMWQAPIYPGFPEWKEMVSQNWQLPKSHLKKWARLTSAATWTIGWKKMLISMDEVFDMKGDALAYFLYCAL